MSTRLCQDGSIKPGSYVVGANVGTEGSFQDLAVLTVYPVEPGDSSAGQWFLSALPACDQQLRRALWAVGSSLGLVPVLFHPRFRNCLLNPVPICLVADTNALFNGTALQAIKLRGRLPTQFVVPDQVFMEIQRQRESRPQAAAGDGSVGEARLQDAVRRARTSRSLRRICALPLPIHYIRPPDPMVRYFGGAGVDGDGLEGVGPGYHRDRLIIEALRQQRSTLSNMPVYLLTSDARLAVQAELEGFDVVFSETTAPEDGILSLTSPWIEPYRFVDDHIDAAVLVEELIWNFRRICLHEHGSPTATVWALPSAEIDVARLELGVLGQERAQRRSLGRRSWPLANFVTSNATGADDATAAGGDGGDAEIRDLPSKAPSAGSLLVALVRATEAGADGLATKDVFQPVVPYLRGLGWVSERDDRLFITHDGAALGCQWSAVAAGKPDAWISWFHGLATIVGRISTVRAARKWLQERERENGESLGRAIGLSQANGDALARFMSAFGLCVRIRGFIFPVKVVDASMVPSLIAEAVRAHQANSQDPEGAVRIDSVFLDVVRKHGVSLIDFREGLLHLHGNGAVKLSGSAPSTTPGQDPISVDTIVPKDGIPDFQAVNLGAGDFLIPGESSQVIRLVAEGVSA